MSFYLPSHLSLAEEKEAPIGQAQKYAAYAFMTLCAFSFAVCGLGFELLAKQMPCQQILIFRCIITCICCWVIGKWNEGKPLAEGEKPVEYYI